MGEVMYHVLHRRRIVTMAGACNVLEHNLRKGSCANIHSELEESKETIPDYINEDFMQFNTYEGCLSKDDFCLEYQKKIDEAMLERKIQRNASRIIETVISSSHSFCKDWKTNPKEREKIKNYLLEAVEWDYTQHGNVALSIVSHWDEMTPHIHILSIPLVGYKDKNTNENKVKFSSSKFFGGKGDLINMHTSFHLNVGKKYGLERGQTGSRASHKELKDYKNWEKEQRSILIEKEKKLSNCDYDLKIREMKVRFNESVVKIKQDEFEKIVVKSNQGAPTIPEPPISFSRSKLQIWVDSVQENVTKAFRGIKAAYESLSDKYSHAVSEIRMLRSANKELYAENLRVKHDLLNKPLEEIQAQREVQSAKKKEIDEPYQEKDRNERGHSR